MPGPNRAMLTGGWGPALVVYGHRARPEGRLGDIEFTRPLGNPCCFGPLGERQCTMLRSSSRGLTLIRRRPSVVAAAVLIAVLPALAGGTALAAPGQAATAAAAASVTPATARDTPLPGAAFFSCYQGNASGGSYTVPANATAVTIVAWGAAGEDVPGASGGKGAAVTATVPVTGGETLTATPGCDGGLVVPFIGQSPSLGRGPGAGGGRGRRRGWRGWRPGRRVQRSARLRRQRAARGRRGRWRRWRRGRGGVI